VHERNHAKWVAGVVALALSASLAMSGLAPAGAAPSDSSPREQREEVRNRQADLASQLDALRATDAEVTQALSDLNANVRAQEALLVDAQRTADQAAVALDQARAAEAAAEATLADLTQRLKQLAVQAYIDPAAQGDPGFSVLGADSANEAVLKTALVDLRAGSNVHLIDQVEAARQDLETQRQIADAALARAEAAERDAVDRLASVTSARDQQQQFAAEVDQRINSNLAEAAGLASLDADLSRTIAAQEAAVAAAAAAAGGSGGGAGSGGVPESDLDLRNVRGIVVAASIADNLESMLSAASADGFTLGGGGYRSSAAQIALRQAHCGTSYYAIYQMPASQCHPPTAPPGSSMHEQGLAVDFTYNGSVISSHSSPAYRWLAAHANAYGFYNLPSEPWHWSVNGK
jgi:hypothetical protein